MRNLRTSEEHGYFYLTYEPEQIDSDDLGRGSGEVRMRFFSEEERAMYINFTKQVEKLENLLLIWQVNNELLEE